ncbi:hypothetical protein FRC03_008958 [Tulasnella sp. 419]|nr:hypothetical protein FRC03_008958 [Tulasnella sp. 419]
MLPILVLFTTFVCGYVSAIPDNFLNTSYGHLQNKSTHTKRDKNGGEDTNGCPDVSKLELALDPRKPEKTGTLVFLYKDINGCAYEHTYLMKERNGGKYVQQKVVTLVKTPASPENTWDLRSDEIIWLGKAALLEFSFTLFDQDQFNSNQALDVNGRGWLRFGYDPKYKPLSHIEEYTRLVDDTGRRHPKISKKDCQVVVQALNIAMEDAIRRTFREYGIQKKNDARYQAEDFVFIDESYRNYFLGPKVISFKAKFINFKAVEAANNRMDARLANKLVCCRYLRDPSRELTVLDRSARLCVISRIQEQHGSRSQVPMTLINPLLGLV